MMKRSGILFTGKKSNTIFTIKTKFLLLCASIFLSQSLSAKSTVCYKKEWTKPSSIESIALDGGECDGKLSLYQMQNKGWFIEDIKIKSGNKGLNYTYVLTDIDPINIQKLIKNKKNWIKEANLTQSFVLINNVKDNTATIAIGNLKIGQSGIVNHTYEDGHKLVVSSAFVTSSNENSSTIKFLPFLDLKQNALPTANRKALNGDEFVLNYLYDFSLLIAPNNDSFKSVRNSFKSNTFMHSDMFGAFLKYIHRPLPTKEIIKDYALAQNMGTIFIVIESTVYILDSRTLAILDKKQISNFIGENQMPFYTRVEKIEASIFDADVSKWLEIAKKYTNKFLGPDTRTEEEILYEDFKSSDNKAEDSKENYTEYYKKLLGV